MMHTASVDFENPARAFALKPVGAWFDSTRSKEIIPVASGIPVLFKYRYHHASFQRDEISVFIATRLPVRQT